MESASAQLVSTAPPLYDEARLAVGGFLARYSRNTRTGYASDLGMVRLVRPGRLGALRRAPGPH